MLCGLTNGWQQSAMQLAAATFTDLPGLIDVVPQTLWVLRCFPDHSTFHDQNCPPLLSRGHGEVRHKCRNDLNTSPKQTGQIAVEFRSERPPNTRIARTDDSSS